MKRLDQLHRVARQTEATDGEGSAVDDVGDRVGRAWDDFVHTGTSLTGAPNGVTLTGWLALVTGAGEENVGHPLRRRSISDATSLEVAAEHRRAGDGRRSERSIRDAIPCLRLQVGQDPRPAPQAQLVRPGSSTSGQLRLRVGAGIKQQGRVVWPRGSGQGGEAVAVSGHFGGIVEESRGQRIYLTLPEPAAKRAQRQRDPLTR